MPCTSGLYQKNQGTVIGGKLKFFQCSCHWSITFRIRLVVGNSVINLSDICHRWGLNLWLRINPIFSSLYHQHSKILGESHKTSKSSKIELDIYRKVLCPPYRAFYLPCQHPHCVIYNVVQEFSNFVSGTAKKLSHKTEKAEL